MSMDLIGVTFVLAVIGIAISLGALTDDDARPIGIFSLLMCTIIMCLAIGASNMHGEITTLKTVIKYKCTSYVVLEDSIGIGQEKTFFEGYPKQKFYIKDSTLVRIDF